MLADARVGPTPPAPPALCVRGRGWVRMRACACACACACASVSPKFSATGRAVAVCGGAPRKGRGRPVIPYYISYKYYNSQAARDLGGEGRVGPGGEGQLVQARLQPVTIYLVCMHYIYIYILYYYNNI